MSRYEEFAYRQMFHLSKEEMANEPMEDVIINFKINEFVNRKQEMDHAIMEERAKQNAPK